MAISLDQMEVLVTACSVSVNAWNGLALERDEGH